MMAALNGFLEVTRYLATQCNADVNATDRRGDTALMKAAYNGKIDAVRCLVEEYDMDVNVTNDVGYTSLMKSLILVKLKLSNISLNLNSKIEVIRYLAEQCGADVNVVNKDGFTALSVAAADVDINIVRYLADGCRAAVRDGKSALMRAAKNGKIEIVQYLAEKCGADVDVNDNDGNTALMKAAENGKLEVVQYLDYSKFSQRKQDHTSSFDAYAFGRMKELWLKVLAHMEKCEQIQYHQEFDKLKKICERLQDSVHGQALFGRFHTLLIEYYQMIRMSPEQARIMRLSSTRVTNNSLYAFQWRVNSLMASLGEAPEAEKKREERWHEQRKDQIEGFVTGVSDT
ncbi:hypothetical protein PC121_g21811, partial [Phytophthora cactorum]